MTSFYRNLQDTCSLKAILEIIALAQEFADIKFPLMDWDALEKRLKNSAPELDLKKRQNENLVSHKVLLILYAHLYRVHVPATVLKDVLSTALLLNKGLLQIAVSRNWLTSCGNVLLLNQCLVQAVPFKSSSLLQLPHIKSVLKHFKTKKRNIEDLEAFNKLTREEMQSLLKSLAPHEIEQIISASLRYPQIEVVRAEYIVQGETEVTASSIITLQVKLAAWYGQEKPEFDIMIEDEAVEKKKQKWWVNAADAASDAYAPHLPIVREINADKEASVLGWTSKR